jgi:hypothetical protein
MNKKSKSLLLVYSRRLLKMLHESDLVCNAYQLLPGETCPAYAYRYRILGTVSRSTRDTWTDELLARCYHIGKQRKHRYLARKIEPWIRETALKLHQTHSTGWEPVTGLSFILERSYPAPGTQWNWDLEDLWRTTAKYKKNLLGN